MIDTTQYVYGTLLFDDPLEQLKQNILHVDMDAFYASLAERDDPSLKGKPVVMAKHPNLTGGRGIVSTANYIARKYGIHSGMPSMKAYQLCPDAVFVPVNHPYVKSVSRQIRDVFRRYTEDIQPIAYDEAYLLLDPTIDAMQVANKIQEQIKQELSLTCSIGVSYNKLMAKLASDYDKPEGVTKIGTKDAVPFLNRLNVEDFQGIGPKTTQKLHALNIFTIKDLKDCAETDSRALENIFGSGVERLMMRVNGVDPSPVRVEREAKSSGNERTFHPFLDTEVAVQQGIIDLIDKLGDTLHDEQTFGTTVVLKLRDSNFNNMSKRITLDYLFNDKATIYDLTWDLWNELKGRLTGSVRLIGITLTGLDHQENGGDGQMLLF